MASRQSIIRGQYVKQFHFTGVVICGICGLGIGSIDELTIDHIVPKSSGGKSRVDNMQPAHYTCNQIKANRLIEGKLNPWEET